MQWFCWAATSLRARVVLFCFYSFLSKLEPVVPLLSSQERDKR